MIKGKIRGNYNQIQEVLRILRKQCIVKESIPECVHFSGCSGTAIFVCHGNHFDVHSIDVCKGAYIEIICSDNKVYRKSKGKVVGKWYGSVEENFAKSVEREAERAASFRDEVVLGEYDDLEFYEGQLCV